MAGNDFEILKQRIKDIPISELLELYVDVVTVNGKKRAICPFHEDHDPSLQINDDKNFWYCFVDSLGGDIFKFVQLKEGLDFVESMRNLCEKLGWNYSDFVKPAGQNPKFSMAKKILDKTTGIYKKIGQDLNHEVYKNFVSSRKIDSEIASIYQLGFAPGNNVLIKYLNSIKDKKEKDFALKTAFELGLIKKNERGALDYYDTFRDRITFPIWDQFGQVVGFTSRATKEKQLAKYRNSEESFLFKKKNILYGLHLAKKFARDRGSIILCEGNMDQRSLYAGGFEHSVALMGLGNLSDHNLDLITNISPNIFLCLDNDKAGKDATTRIHPQFLERGISPRYIDLSPDKDPDDFLKNQGRIEFQKRMDDAPAFIDVILGELLPDPIPEIMDRKLEILEQCFKILSPLRKSLQATERVISFAKSLSLATDSSFLLEQYDNYLKANEKAPEKSKEKRAVTEEYEAPTPPEFNIDSLREESYVFQEEVSLVNISNEDKILMAESIRHPECMLHDAFDEVLDFVRSNEVKKYVSKLRELYQEVDENEFPKVVREHLSRESFSQEIVETITTGLNNYRSQKLETEVIDKIMIDLKRSIQLTSLKSERLELKLKQKHCQTQSEFDTLMNSIINVDKKINQLRSTQSFQK